MEGYTLPRNTGGIALKIEEPLHLNRVAVVPRNRKKRISLIVFAVVLVVVFLIPVIGLIFR